MTHPTDALRLVPVEPTREQWLWAARIVRELGPSMSPGAMAMTMERLAEKAAPASPLPEGGGLPADVVRLVIAARRVAYEGAAEDDLRALDIAAEAFASRVPWDDEPDELPAAPTGAA